MAGGIIGNHGIKSCIEDWLKGKVIGNYSITEKFAINVDGDVCIKNIDIEELPFYITFDSIEGNFILYNCHKLNSSKGFPIHVTGDFVYEECELLTEDDIKYVEKNRVWKKVENQSVEGWMKYFESGRMEIRPLRDIGGKIKTNIKNEVRQWMKKYVPNLEENMDYDLEIGPFSEPNRRTTIIYDNICTIFVSGKDVVLIGYQEEELPEFINFGRIIGGSFICSHSNFKSMRGFPKVVGKYFDCSFCSGITTLDNAPELVDIDFAAVNCGRKFTEEEIREGRQITCKVYC